MKKTLLSMVALALSLGMNAQLIMPFNGSVERNASQSATKTNGILKSAPKKSNLPDNQRYVGSYFSEDWSETGSGLPSFVGSNKVAQEMTTSDILEKYVGMKIVGMRFAIAYKNDANRAFVSALINNKLSDVLSKAVESPAVGWNTVIFDEPYTIKDGDDLVVGFDYVQKNTNNGYYYSDECYPLSIVENDLFTEAPLLIYGTYNNQTGWWSLGSGNLSVQLIVEGAHNAYDVSPFAYEKVDSLVGKKPALTVDFLNMSKEAVNNITYTYTIDGVVGPEQTIALDEPVSGNGYGQFVATLPEFAKEGIYDVDVEVEKINGNDNASSAATSRGNVGIYTVAYPKNVLVEEFTTEQCPNCPRVAGFLKTALSTADLTRVYPVCHHAGYGTDWLTKTWDSDMLSLMYGGSAGNAYAPAMTFNRDYKLMKGGYDRRGVMILPTSADLITAYFNAITSTVSDVKLTMTATKLSDNSHATVIVEGECNEAFSEKEKADTKITFYLTEDQVRAKSQAGASGIYYHEHVIRANNSTWGEAITWDGNKFTATFDVDINSGWSADNMKFVAAVSNYDSSYDESGYYKNLKVINVTGMNYNDATTGINGVFDAQENVETVRYSLDGVRLSAPQKGLNIVKMANGKTMKVVVK